MVDAFIIFMFIKIMVENSSFLKHYIKKDINSIQKIFKVPLAIYLTKNKNTILLIIKSFKLVKTFKKRNKIGLSARITIK